MTLQGETEERVCWPNSFAEALERNFSKIQSCLLIEYNAVIAERERELRQSVAVLTKQNIELIQWIWVLQDAASSTRASTVKSGGDLFEAAGRPAATVELKVDDHSLCGVRQHVGVLREQVIRMCVHLGVEMDPGLALQSIDVGQVGTLQIQGPKTMSAGCCVGQNGHVTEIEGKASPKSECSQKAAFDEVEGLEVPREKTTTSLDMLGACGALSSVAFQRVVSPQASGSAVFVHVPRKRPSKISTNSECSLKSEGQRCISQLTPRDMERCITPFTPLTPYRAPSQCGSVESVARTYVLKAAWVTEEEDQLRRTISPGSVGSGRVSVYSKKWHLSSASGSSTSLGSGDTVDTGYFEDMEADDDEESTEARKWWIILPSSKKRLVWDLLSTILLAWDLVFMPLQLGFAIQDAPWLTALTLFTAVFWTFDAFMSVITGYYTKEGKVVVSQCQILRQYLRSWFWLDVVIISLDWVLISIGNEDKNMRAGRLLRSMRMLRIFRLLRLAKLQKVMRMLQDHIDSEYVTILLNVGKHMLQILATCHVVACAWYRIGLDSLPGGTLHAEGQTAWLEANEIKDESLLYQYLTALHWSLTQFTPASMAVNPTNVCERLFAVVVLLYAMVVFSSFVSSITSAMNNLRNMGAKQNSQFWLLRKFFRQHEISQELSRRVYRYVSMVLMREQMRVQQGDVELLTILSEPLRFGLLAELYEPQLISHTFFGNLSRRCRAIFRKLCCVAIKTVDLSKGDVLFTAGETARCMFIVTRGELAYATVEKNRHVLGKGHWCCEAVLWTEWVHRGTMGARSECELLALDANQFSDVLLEHPSQLVYPCRHAVDFVNKLNERIESNGVWHSDVMDMDENGRSGGMKRTATSTELNELSPSSNLSPSRNR